MRIIAGQLRGRTLPSKGFEGIRPTTDRARETLFNVLENITSFDTARVLDICAGTGALGIEALSRGAASAVFIEKNRSNARALSATLRLFHLHHATQVLTADALDALQALSTLANEQHEQTKLRPPFSLIFCDPPYGLKLCTTIFQQLHTLSLADKEAIFVAEHDARELVRPPEGWLCAQRKLFGETVIEIFVTHSSASRRANG
jgi:16S rRNA (guanine966-N2)-methyltransferase